MNVLQLAGMPAQRNTENGMRVGIEPTDWADFIGQDVLAASSSGVSTELDEISLSDAEIDLAEFDLLAEEPKAVKANAGEIDKDHSLEDILQDAPFADKSDVSIGSEQPHSAGLRFRSHGDGSIHRPEDLPEGVGSLDLRKNIDLAGVQKVEQPNVDPVQSPVTQAAQKRHSGSAQSNVEAAFIAPTGVPKQNEVVRSERDQPRQMMQIVSGLDQAMVAPTIKLARATTTVAALDFGSAKTGINMKDATIVEGVGLDQRKGAIQNIAGPLDRVEKPDAVPAGEIKSKLDFVSSIQRDAAAEFVKLAEDIVARSDAPGGRITGPSQIALQPTLPNHSAPAIASHPAVFQISQALQAAETDQIELRLDPAELGKVRITMAARDGIMVATIAVERAETLDLLRRNSDTLDLSFSDQGFGETQLSFEHFEDEASSDPQLEQDFHTGAVGSMDKASLVVMQPSPAGGLDIKL